MRQLPPNLAFRGTEQDLNNIIATIAAAVLFAGQAVANPEFDNHANYGSVLQDTGSIY